MTIGLALRLCPVLSSFSREARQDTILPRGGGPDGTSPIMVTSGLIIAFSVAAMHRRKDLWGEDADEFRPERWINEKPSWVSHVFSLSCFSKLRKNFSFRIPQFSNITGINKPCVPFRNSSLSVVAHESAWVVSPPSSSLVLPPLKHTPQSQSSDQEQRTLQWIWPPTYSCASSKVSRASRAKTPAMRSKIFT